MKFSKHVFFVFSLLLAFLSQFTLAVAGEIPGYVGQQSFRLDDDSELRDLTRKAEDAKSEVARLDRISDQIEGQVKSLVEQRDSLINRMNELQRRIDGAKTLKASLQASLEELNKNPEVNKEEINDVQNKIHDQEGLMADLSRQYGASKLELGPVNVKLDQIQRDVAIARQNTQVAMGRLQNISRDRELYRQDLINAIQAINGQGARSGATDGSNDGSSLARRLGQDLGSRDGSLDGTKQGTLDGQDRDYRRGLDQGEREGSTRAKSDGLRDGTNEGTISGNKEAANREGRAAGNKRGDASDAAAVGTSQGKKAGMDRAIKTGSINGNNKGENETVTKFETGELKALNVNGPFAGSFARKSPDYPGDFNGPSFNPNVYNSREVLKKAYADGYLDQYRQFTRYEFLRRIDGEYNAVYDSNYSIAYDQSNNRQYPDYFNRGRSEGDARAYSREYPVSKAAAFKLAFDRFNTNPNRNSAEYKTTYTASELEAYKTRYEQIRRDNFDRLELLTFNANIDSQTEIFRQKRIAEVTTVYNNNAVLLFVGSDIADGGINEVAKLDGVFQPGETTFHSITLKNFGFKPAQNVTVQLDNGVVIKMPEIAARSLVVIKGAGVSQISGNAALGSTAKTTLKVVSKLTSDDAVEGQHFDSIGGGVLKNAEQKAVRVAFPLQLSNLSLNSQLLKGVANKLSIAVTNNSKRPYAGEMKIKLDVNSQSPLITKEFGVLSSLQTTSQLSDAEVLVKEDADIYRDLSFSATISQNGVTLGILPADMVVMAKTQYEDKGKLPVIIANSDKNTEHLLDALSLIGGTAKASVLDLSLSSLNASTVASGLSGKILLVVDDEKGSNIKSLNTFVAKSKSSSFVFIDDTNSGLKNALTLVASKDAQRLLWDKKVVMFTNPHRAEGVLKSSAMVQSSLRSFDKDLSLAHDLTLTAPELLAKLKAEINRTTFFTPSNTIKMFSFKAMSEVLCINKAYDESGGVFSRDKKWVNMIGDDNTLFINVLKSTINGDVTEAKLSTVLPAIALKDTLSTAMSWAEGISKAMMSKIQNATDKVLDNMEEGYKKSLKKFNVELYNKAYEKAPIHRPFYINNDQD